MSDIEGGQSALALASGMAAINTALLTIVRSGDHDLLSQNFGVAVSYVDGTRTETVITSIRENTRLIYIETPANPTLCIMNIAAICSSAKTRSIFTLVDNTFATPFNQQPLKLGADAVVHSATKYLGGHGDLLAGVLVGSSDFLQKVRWRTHKLLGV